MFEGLFEEQYEDDDAPISAFSEVALGGAFYDHDFVETKFVDQASPDVVALLGRHSYAASFAAAASSALGSNPIAASPVLNELGFRGAFNAVVLVYDAAEHAPRLVDRQLKSVENSGFLIHYLGRFNTSRRSWRRRGA